MSLLVEDRRLLEEFRRGTPQALERVYAHYVDHVAAFLRGGFTFSSGGQLIRFKGLQSPSELQDVLQETFCRAFHPRARVSYDGIHPYAPFLLTIARTLVPYVAACALTGMALTALWFAQEGIVGGGGAAAHPIALSMVFEVLQLYAWVVVMRVIGLYYHHFKDRFAWSWE